MKKIRVVLQTDGDFSVLGRTDLDFSKTDYEYIFEFTTNDVYTDLSKILCDIHVSYTHEYLIYHLYEFFHKAMNNSHSDNYYDTYNGNYEGTLIEWKENENRPEFLREYFNKPIKMEKKEKIIPCDTCVKNGKCTLQSFDVVKNEGIAYCNCKEEVDGET